MINIILSIILAIVLVIVLIFYSSRKSKFTNKKTLVDKVLQFVQKYNNDNDTFPTYSEFKQEFPTEIDAVSHSNLRKVWHSGNFQPSTIELNL